MSNSTQYFNKWYGHIWSGESLHEQPWVLTMPSASKSVLVAGKFQDASLRLWSKLTCLNLACAASISRVAHQVARMMVMEGSRRLLSSIVVASVVVAVEAAVVVGAVVVVNYSLSYFLF